MTERDPEQVPESDGADDAGEDTSPPAEPDEATENPAVAIGILGGVTVATAVAVWFAFAPENAATTRVLLPMAVLYGPLAVFAVLRHQRAGRLPAYLSPVRLDITFGAVVAAGLYGCAKLGQLLLAGPGTRRESWVMHLSLFLGEPRKDVERIAAAAGVFAVAVAEEVVWRGLVQDALLRAMPSRRSRVIALTSLGFAVAHLPTAARLAVPGVGPNPLLVLAGFGCSAVWGWIAARNGRLAPSMLAHGLWSWAVYEFPLWRL